MDVDNYADYTLDACKKAEIRATKLEDGLQEPIRQVVAGIAGLRINAR